MSGDVHEPKSSDATDMDTTDADADADELAAARSALKRAQAAAAERGLRPGSRPLRSRMRGYSAVSPSSQRKAGRDPHPLGSNLKRLLHDRGWDVDVAAGSVMARWNELVGPTVSAHVQPVTFENQILTVRADSTAWATQVSLLSSKLLSQIEQGIGAGVVQELKVVGPAAPSWTRGPRRVAGRGPRDTYG